MWYVRMFFVIGLLLIAPSRLVYAQEVERNEAKCVALTFDDGPDRVLTPRLLAILREKKVRVTFYLVGWRVVSLPAVVAEMRRDGHEIGNHSWTHPNLTRISITAVQRQLEMTDSAIAAITGAVPKTTRPPYGAINERIRTAFPQRFFVLWDVDTLDWRYPFSWGIKNRVLTRVRDRSVVLMHDIHHATIEATPGIIDGLKSLGYTFVTVSQLYEGRCGRYDPLSQKPAEIRRVLFLTAVAYFLLAIMSAATLFGTVS